MTDRDRLLAAILANPADDVVRLVYADYIEEQGYKRWADFIRADVLFDANAPDAQSKLLEIENLWGSWPDEDDPRTLMRKYCPVLEPMVVLPEHLVSHREPENMTIAIVLKGFVAVVRGSLATLRGDRCPSCDVSPGIRRYATHGGNWIEDECNVCHGTGRTAGVLREIAAVQPIEYVEVTDAVIHPSGGNMTYYLGGLGMFAKEYWQSLEGLPSHRAVRDALSRVMLAEARAVPLTGGPQS